MSFKSGTKIEEETYKINSKSPKKLTIVTIDASEELIKIQFEDIKETLPPKNISPIQKLKHCNRPKKIKPQKIAIK